MSDTEREQNLEKDSAPAAEPASESQSSASQTGSVAPENSRDFHFDNEILREALQRMREDHSDETLLKAGQALMDTRVLVPAKWDKEPVRTEDGKISFPPDAQLSFMTAKDSKGEKSFPFFTSLDEMKNAFGNPGVNCMVLGAEQFMPMIRNAKDDVNGIVIDPAGVNIRFPADFLIGFNDAYKSPLKERSLKQNDNVYMKDPTGNLQNLEAALISAGFHEKAINAIYLKERLKDPKKPETAWFILVDSDEKDTGIFTRISAAVKKAIENDKELNKDLEFMFTDSKLGQDIAKSTHPIYVRAF